MSEPEPRSHTSFARLVATGVAVLVPLAVIVVALVLSGSGGTAAGGAAAGGATFVPAGATQTGTTRTGTTQASASRTGAGAATPSKSAGAGLNLPPGRGALVAELTHPTDLRAGPAGRVMARLSTKTEFGSPEVMWVARRAGRWLGVVSPEAGNDRVGWIQASAASLSRVSWQLKVSLQTRTLTVLANGRVAHRYTVAIGAPAAPTPTGRYAVTDRLLTGNPAGPYGCCILALSATAPHAIQDWSGGNRIAIHSTPETGTIGEAVSHGCIRLTLAEGRWLVDHIPLGTPTLISS
ncbi:MAG TPA: L,D-transpeptidase [Solirubrobacteraceae bacterium]|nr:L,D-transpeptidase [Solirubrobacteraceae bacterium]